MSEQIETPVASGPEKPVRGPDLFSLASVIAIQVGLVFAGARLVSVGSQQTAILKELQAIKAALEDGGRPAALPTAPPDEPAPPENVSLTINGSATAGSSSAKLTLIEFSDFECPFCGRYVRDTLAQLKREYVDTGKVRYVFRHFPLEDIHPRAVKAGAAAECARRQGKFWEMHDRIFADQRALAEADLARAASGAGLNASEYERCLKSDAEKVVRQDMNEGERAGVTGTPFFFMGVSEGNGAIKVLKRLSGAQPYDVFKATLDELLAGAPAKG